MDENQIRDELKKYEFYHIIQLTEDISTPGFPNLVRMQDVPLRALRSLDLTKKRVLDIGCRDGLFSFEAEKLGAQEIIGIDNDLSLGAVNFLIPFFKSKVKMYELNLLDLKPETFGLFDVIIFPGVLYHLRYPFWSLKLINDVLREGGKLIIETTVYMDENQFPILLCPIGSESPFEPTSCTFFNLKGLIDTLSSLDLAVEDIELLDNNNALSVTTSGFNYSTAEVATPIDRVTLVCSKQLQPENSRVSSYWNSTHDVHTINKL
jgi:SAM-dependent methyltransferase